MIVFKVIHDLCHGEVSLFSSDLSLLAKHVEVKEKAEGEGGGRGGKEKQEEGKAEDTKKGNNQPLDYQHWMYIYNCAQEGNVAFSGCVCSRTKPSGLVIKVETEKKKVFWPLSPQDVAYKVSLLPPMEFYNYLQILLMVPMLPHPLVLTHPLLSLLMTTRSPRLIKKPRSADS